MIRRLITTTGSIALLAFLAVPAIRAQQQTQVTCKDGTSDAGGRGACRGHGGVDKTAAAKTGTSPKIASTRSKTTSKSTTAARSTAAIAKVTCKDGTTDDGGRGACSGHGGVQKAAAAAPAARSAATMPAPPAATVAPAPTRAAPAPSAPRAATTPAPRSTANAAADQRNVAAGATAQCKDGTYSHSQTHTGACSRHGGVSKWLDKP